jgi:hypothetical protein
MLCIAHTTINNRGEKNNEHKSQAAQQFGDRHLNLIVGKID